MTSYSSDARTLLKFITPTSFFLWQMLPSDNKPDERWSTFSHKVRVADAKCIFNDIYIDWILFGKLLMSILSVNITFYLKSNDKLLRIIVYS